MPKVELKRWFSLVLAMEGAISRRQTKGADLVYPWRPRHADRICPA
jgi:hypothetical protein